MSCRVRAIVASIDSQKLWSSRHTVLTVWRLCNLGMIYRTIMRHVSSKECQLEGEDVKDVAPMLELAYGKCILVCLH